MEPDDEALVEACRQGDPAAWETLVARYQRLIYAIPRRAGLPDEAAADVFQRVWTTLLEQLDRIEQPGRVGAWLVTTTKRETWRVLRSQRTDVVSCDDLDTEVATMFDESLLPEAELVRLEEQHMVRTAVDMLEERCRTLLVLLFYRPAPPPYSEVAAALGTTEGSIGPTRARCLQKLRQLLDQAGFLKESEDA